MLPTHGWPLLTFEQAKKLAAFALARLIEDIERVEIVFKDGVGYDSGKLMAAGKGLVGNQ